METINTVWEFLHAVLGFDLIFGYPLSFWLFLIALFYHLRYQKIDRSISGGVADYYEGYGSVDAEARYYDASLLEVLEANRQANLRTPSERRSENLHGWAAVFIVFLSLVHWSWMYVVILLVVQIAAMQKIEVIEVANRKKIAEVVEVANKLVEAASTSNRR